MISIQSLYDPIRHRYQGVFPSLKRWRTIVRSIDGSLKCLGTYETQEEGARAVASYYLSIFGNDWEDVVSDRRVNAWAVKRVDRTSSITVWLAEIKPNGNVSGKQTIRVTPTDVGMESEPLWSIEGNGWLTPAAAYVAVRVYRYLHGISSVTSSLVVDPALESCPA